MTTNLRQKLTAAILAVAIVTVATGTAWAQGGQWSRVEAYATSTWNLWGYAGQTITVIVDGDGDTDLDLYVYGGRQLVVFDDDETDYCVVTFTVHQTGNFTLQVRNLGSVWNRYRVSTSIR